MPIEGVEVGQRYQFNNAEAVVISESPLQVRWHEPGSQKERHTPRWYFIQHAYLITQGK